MSDEKEILTNETVDEEIIASDDVSGDISYEERREARRQLDEARRAKVVQQKKMILIGIPVIIALIALIIIGTKFVASHKDDTNENDVKTEEADTEKTEEETEDPLALKENDIKAIDKLVENYYAAMAACDAEELAKYVDDIGDITNESLEQTAQYFENYENIECYTKPGPYDDTLVVYVYYEAKILNIDTPAPSVSTLYVLYDKETDTYRIHNGVTTGEIAAYIKTVSEQEDVVALFDDVNKRLEEACETDEDLKAFYDAIITATEEESKAKEETTEEKTTEETTKKSSKKDNTEDSTDETESDTEESTNE